MPEAQPKGLTNGYNEKLIRIVAVFASLFHFYLLATGGFPALVQRPIHWAFMAILVYLMYPIKCRNGFLYFICNWFPGILSAITGMYLAINHLKIAMRVGSSTKLEMVFGLIAIVLILEAGRRALGKVFPIMALVAIAYAYFGSYFPGIFANKGYSLQRISSILYLTAEGIYGVPLSTSTTYIAGFVLFGSILEKCGVTSIFADLGSALTKGTRGSSGKTAVISSSLFGLVSGGAVSNVVVSGTFTIPWMRKSGYTPTMAGAIEALASTGGQIMPPVMGAGAFLMVEFLNIPYSVLMVSAFVPAALYYLNAFCMVDFHAALNSDTLDKAANDDRSLLQVIKEKGILLMPIIILIVMILTGSSVFKAVLYSIILSPVADFIARRKIVSLKAIADGFEDAAKSTVCLATACATAGILVGMLSLTGLGSIFSSAIMYLSGGNLIAALIITMLTCILFGMGMPTTAAYVVLATLGAPALIQMGVSPMAAHMFIFYFACFAPITPPVALASYAAAAIANEDPWKVGICGAKMSVPSFLIPFVFVLNSNLLLQGTPMGIAAAIVTTAIAIMAMAGGIQGYCFGRCGKVTRALMIASGVLMIYPELYSTAVGACILLAAVAGNRMKKKATISNS